MAAAGACISNSLLALRELALHEGALPVAPPRLPTGSGCGAATQGVAGSPHSGQPFYLIYPSREHLAPALRSLMDFVAERLPFA